MFIINDTSLRYGKCRQNCEEALLEKQCGKEAPKLMKTIYQSLLDSINGLIRMGTAFNENITKPYEAPCKAFDDIL